MARPGEARLVLARLGGARQGYIADLSTETLEESFVSLLGSLESSDLARRGSARRGVARPGEARPGFNTEGSLCSLSVGSKRFNVWPGLARQGSARHG